MQGSVTMDTIAAFMPVFFHELQRDGQIDRALAAARASVITERPDWWMPVLFMRTPDGMLWRTPAPDAIPAAPQPARPSAVDDFVGREAELVAFVIFAYLVPLLDGQGYLLCLDDFQYVDEDPQLEQFVARLRPQLAAGRLSLLITSRRAPGFAILSEVEVLTGLSPDDTRGLLAARGLELPPELFAQLYEQTGGNAQLLTLAIDALRRTSSPARLVGDLIDADDIVRYLMREVDDGLSDDERLVMRACSALLDRGGTRGAIKALRDGASVRNTLLTLVERYLLTGSEGPSGKEYRPHAMVQAFYYDDLDRAERETLHRRAALLYATEAHDSLYAALHFERAGDDERAVDVATAAATALINAGQARPLRQLLERFVGRQLEPADPRRLDPERWVAVNLACGEVGRARGRGPSCSGAGRGPMGLWTSSTWAARPSTGSWRAAPAPATGSACSSWRCGAWGVRSRSARATRGCPSPCSTGRRPASTGSPSSA